MSNAIAYPGFREGRHAAMQFASQAQQRQRHCRAAAFSQAHLQAQQWLRLKGGEQANMARFRRSMGEL